MFYTSTGILSPTALSPFLFSPVRSTRHADVTYEEEHNEHSIIFAVIDTYLNNWNKYMGNDIVEQNLIRYVYCITRRHRRHRNTSSMDTEHLIGTRSSFLSRSMNRSGRTSNAPGFS